MKETATISTNSINIQDQSSDYDIRMFAILAGCFMVAVPVTISGTIIVRLISTYTQLYKLFWRYFGVLAAPFVISTYSLSLYSPDTNAYFAYLIINDLYFAIVTAQGYRQARRNPTTTRKWLTFGLAALVCCIIDNALHFYVTEQPFKSHAVMALPWALLAWHWQSRIQARRAHDTATTSMSPDVAMQTSTGDSKTCSD